MLSLRLNFLPSSVKVRLAVATTPGSISAFFLLPKWCDRCGQILAHSRFTRFGESGEWRSPTCRDHEMATKKYRQGGRPRKYQSERQRRTAQRYQNANRQRSFRQNRSVTQNPLTSRCQHVSALQHRCYGRICAQRSNEQNGIARRPRNKKSSTCAKG